MLPAYIQQKEIISQTKIIFLQSQEQQVSQNFTEKHLLTIFSKFFVQAEKNFVVYFEQHLGTAHSFFLGSSFSLTIVT